MSVPQYVGAAMPVQVVKVRLGRFSRYYQDNPVGNKAEGEEPNGAGHQSWVGPPCLARVGKFSGTHANPYYAKPWQAKWLPTTPYVVLPNVLDVKQDKKLEGLIGGIGTATVQIENVLYTDAGGYHLRERGAMSPLRGKHATENAYAPAMPALLDEIEKVVATNEWEGRLDYAAQITVYQGYGSVMTKAFTGLIENIDSTSRPDRIIVTCRDFGQVFTETHFFGWGKDPIIDTPVIFVDAEDATQKRDVGMNAHASNEDKPEHTADKVLDFDPKKVETWWQTNVVHSVEQTEFVEIGLPEGVYHFADIKAKWAGMDAYFSLHPTMLTGGLAPTRMVVGKGWEDMTVANGLIDKAGWVDPTKKEEQLVPGVNGGNSYLRLVENFPGGNQQSPLETSGGGPTGFRVGNNSVLRISFRKLHKVEAGENFRAGVVELHGLREATEAGAGLAEWVIVQDIADVIRVICQWAGFKEWDIPDTGARLPQRLTVYQDKSYMDIIKQICEGIGFTFFMADPVADSAPRGEESLGVPTFRKARMLAKDSEAEQKAREEGKEANGTILLPNRGSNRPGLPNPVITDKTLLTAIQLKQSTEPLSYVIRVWGYTKTLPGDAAAGVASGQQVSYTLRPPWTGDPKVRYADTRLGGVLKSIVHHDPLFSSEALCRQACLFIALQQAIESAEATIEFPAYPGLDLDDHARLMDLGTGLTTRIAVLSRSSSFVDGEKRKFTMTVTGVLLDTPDVRDMVDIINGLKVDNGAGGVWVDPREGEGSSLGYG